MGQASVSQISINFSLRAIFIIKMEFNVATRRRSKSFYVITYFDTKIWNWKIPFFLPLPSIWHVQRWARASMKDFPPALMFFHDFFFSKKKKRKRIKKNSIHNLRHKRFFFNNSKAMFLVNRTDKMNDLTVNWHHVGSSNVEGLISELLRPPSISRSLNPQTSFVTL